MRSVALVGLTGLLLASVAAADGVALREPPYNVYAWRKKYDFPESEDWTLKKLIQCDPNVANGPLNPGTALQSFLWASNSDATHYRLAKLDTADGSVAWVRNYYFSSNEGFLNGGNPTCVLQNRLLIMTSKRVLILDTSDEIRGTIEWAFDVRDYGTDYQIREFVASTPDVTFGANSNNLASYAQSEYFYVMWTSDYPPPQGKAGFQTVWTIASFSYKTGHVDGAMHNFTDVNGCSKLGFGRAKDVHVSFICTSLDGGDAGDVHLRWLTAPAATPAIFSKDALTVTPKHARNENSTVGVAKILGEDIFLAFTPYGVIRSWNLNNKALNVDHDLGASTRSPSRESLVEWGVGKNPGDGKNYVFTMTKYKMTSWTTGSNKLDKSREKTFTTSGGSPTPSLTGASLVAGGQWAVGDWFITLTGTSNSYLYRFSLTSQEFIWCSQLPNKASASKANLPLDGALIGSPYVYITSEANSNPVVSQPNPTHKYYQADYSNGEMTLGIGMEEASIFVGWDPAYQRPTVLSDNYLRQFIPTAVGRAYIFESAMKTSTILNNDLYVTEGSTLRRFSTAGNLQGNTAGSFNGVPSISVPGVQNSYSNSESHVASFAGTSFTATSSDATSVVAQSSDGEDCNTYLKDGTPATNFRSPIEVWYINLIGTMEFLDTTPVLMDATQEIIYAAKDTSETPNKYYWVKFHASTGRYIRRILVTGMVSGQSAGTNCEEIDGVKIYADQAAQEIFWVSDNACLVRMDRFSVFTGAPSNSLNSWIYLTPDSKYVLSVGSPSGDTEVVRFNRKYLGNTALGIDKSSTVRDHRGARLNPTSLACDSPSHGMVYLDSVWVVCGKATNMLLSFSVHSLYRQSHTSLWGAGRSADFGEVAPWVYGGSIYVAGNTGTVIKTSVANGINSSVTIDFIVQTKSNYSLGNPIQTGDGGFVFAATQGQGLYLITAWGTLVWEIVDRMDFGQATEFNCRSVKVSAGAVIAICNDMTRYINLFDGQVYYTGPKLSSGGTNYLAVVGSAGGNQQLYQITSTIASYTELQAAFSGTLPGAPEESSNAAMYAGIAIAGVVVVAGAGVGIAFALGLIGGGGAAAAGAGAAAKVAVAGASDPSPTATPLLGDGAESSPSYKAPEVDGNPDAGRGEEMSASQQSLPAEA